jgi:hypothetical protein
MDNEKLNTYSSLIFIELVFTSKKFLSEIKKNFEKLHEVIETLTKSNSEENQEHLKSLFFHNEEKLKSFLNDFLKRNESEFNWTTFLNKYEVVHVAGRFFKIDKTEEAYKSFVIDMKKNRWAFNYMSVTSEDDKYVIFFA